MADTALSTLDVSTLRVVAVVLGAVAFLLIYFGVYRVARVPYAKWWSILLLMQVLGAAAYLIDSEAARPFTGPLGNMFGSLGAILALVAARSIRGEKTPWWVYFAPPALLAVASVVEAPSGHAWPGGGATPVFMAIVMGFTSYEFLTLVRQKRETHSSVARREIHVAAMAMLILSAAISVFYIVRTVIYFAMGPSSAAYADLVGPVPTTLGACIVILVVVYGVSELSRFEASQMWRVRADQDDLTSLLNRNAFRTEAERLLAGANRGTAALMILDFDRFKQLNDSRGHHMGDRALTAFAQACRDHLRPGDMAGRWGGDEFVVALTKGSEASVREVYAVLNTAVMAVSRRTDGVVTLSAGVARVEPHDTLDSLIAKADAALYQAKRDGRGQLVFADA